MENFRRPAVSELSFNLQHPRPGGDREPAADSAALGSAVGRQVQADWCNGRYWLHLLTPRPARPISLATEILLPQAYQQPGDFHPQWYRFARFAKRLGRSL